MADTDLTDAIQNAAAAPQQVTGDTGSVTQQSLRDLIEADKYLSLKRAMSRGVGIRRVQMIPPGAAGVDFCR